MPKINVLDKHVAELIAAGEVVERPASIVKELVENSIDAGATSITVEIQGGGVRMIRIIDNGCGISRDDIPKAFLRHATSKVQTASDLDSILTLGFRGEALASIAAMCRVELVTRSDEDNEGTSYKIEGGSFVDSVPAGCPVGTTIIVRDIFFNTPARMKFLKSDMGEGNAVAQVVDKCALSHPETAFKFIKDGQVKLTTSGNCNLQAVIMAVYGAELSTQMLPVDYTLEGSVHVEGYISRPSAARPSRAYQNFFINSRFVRSKTCGAALEEAFKAKLMSGKFPACALNIRLTANSVDVNVHPAKIEVRFANEKPIFSAVYYAVKSALSSDIPAHIHNIEEQKSTPSKINELTIHAPKQEAVQQRLSVAEFRAQSEMRNDDIPPVFSQPLTFRSSSLDIFVEDNEQPERPVTPYSDVKIIALKPPVIDEPEKVMPEPKPNEVCEIRLIGELFGTYIVAQRGTDMLLIDKHAAHERIIYEELVQNAFMGNGQLLISPVSVTLSKDEYGAVIENIPIIQGMGFDIEDFGNGTVIVREAPVELDSQDIAGIVGEIASKLLKGLNNAAPETLDKLYYSIACKSAIRSGDKNSGEELREIIRRLEKNPDIAYCPHGRPVSIGIGRSKLEKMFGRIV